LGANVNHTDDVVPAHGDKPGLDQLGQFIQRAGQQLSLGNKRGDEPVERCNVVQPGRPDVHVVCWFCCHRRMFLSQSLRRAAVNGSLGIGDIV